MLQRYSYKVKVKGNSKDTSLTAVSSEVLQIWANEGIPARQHQHVKICHLFDIAHQDAMKITKSTRGNKENIFFLNDLTGPRKMMMRVWMRRTSRNMSGA